MDADDERIVRIARTRDVQLDRPVVIAGVADENMVELRSGHGYGSCHSQTQSNRASRDESAKEGQQGEHERGTCECDGHQPNSRGRSRVHHTIALLKWGVEGVVVFARPHEN